MFTVGHTPMSSWTISDSIPFNLFTTGGTAPHQLSENISDVSELDFKEEEVVTTECFLFEDDDAETIILEAFERDVLGMENVELEARDDVLDVGASMQSSAPASEALLALDGVGGPLTPETLATEQAKKGLCQEKPLRSLRPQVSDAADEGQKVTADRDDVLVAGQVEIPPQWCSTASR